MPKLSGFVPVDVPDPGPAPPPPAPPPGPPRIGRFALIRKVGEGGMGVVHVAYDEALDRRIAVKVLHRGAASAQWLRREAQALAKLSHPNVVPVYEVGEHQGRLFLAMEYVSGATLRRLLEERPPVQTILRHFLQAGRGLAAAHAAGLVHRDFKPDNVLVGRDGRARVVDFGIASLSEDDTEPAPLSRAHGMPISASPSALAQPMTQTGALLGTPAFMSPEQFHGERATAKSDQFSFCVAVYTAIYGQRPFEGETLIEIGQAVTSGFLRPPPSRMDGPPWLWTLLQRGLSRDPEERFPTIAALLDAIEGKLPSDPDLDPSTSRRERRTAFVMIFGHMLITAGYHIWHWPQSLLSRGYLLGLGVSFLLVSLLTVGLLWKGLKQNRAGRQIASLLICAPAMMVAHRLIALRLATPLPHVVVIDLLLFTCVLLVAALGMVRRLLPVAGLGLAATTAATIYPAAALPLLGLVAFAAALSGIHASHEDH